MVYWGAAMRVKEKMRNVCRSGKSRAKVEGGRSRCVGEEREDEGGGSQLVGRGSEGRGGDRHITS